MPVKLSLSAASAASDRGRHDPGRTHASRYDIEAVRIFVVSDGDSVPFANEPQTAQSPADPQVPSEQDRSTAPPEGPPPLPRSPEGTPSPGPHEGPVPQRPQ